jgi:DNA-directed RNA polymerase specialized sigma24 family protein
MPLLRRSPSPTGPELDELYLASRRRLVLQTYALTGDLTAARRAVAEAFVSARHHWRKVSRWRDPEEWVRARAWAIAQRRHAGRIWHREKGLSEEQRGVLDALHRLPAQHRRAMLLTHLAALGPEDVARELGMSDRTCRARLQAAASAYCERTDTRPDGVRTSLESLAPVAEAAALPGPDLVHRQGRRRHQLHTVLGTLGLVLAVLLGGLFVSGGTVDEPGSTATTTAQHRREPREVSQAMLLGLDQVTRLAPTERWTLTGTSDNTGGTGINSVCQGARFADPLGRGAFVRTFAAAGTPQRRYVQTVEVSKTEQGASAAYRTTSGWYAGCDQARVQLLNAYSVTGLGDEAQLLRLRIPNKVRRTYLVGIARTGMLTVSTVLETLGGQPPAVPDATRGLADAVRNVCMSSAAGDCPLFTRVAPVLPPLSGETRGTLAAADLPVIGSIDKPWVGTAPVPARVNVAATTCDRTDFVKEGVSTPLTRTFLIPQARLPRQFGITETYGRLPGIPRARALVTGVVERMAGCEKKDLGAKVSEAVVQRGAYRGSEYALWRLDSEINDQKQTVGYWMGVVRVGPWVAQVNFTAAGRDDIDADTFQALVTRTRDRLFELDGGAQ